MSMFRASERPDYAAIAAMEMEIWGRTFEHPGAPAPKRSRYCSYFDITMLEDRCGTCHGWYSGHSPMCAVHDTREPS